MFAATVGLGGATLLSTSSTGCSPIEENVESTEQANTAQDLADAKDVLALLGGPNGRCKNCHGVTATKVRAWGNALKDVETQCFAPANLSAQERVNCLRSIPSNSSSPFSARRLGLYATDASHDSFKNLFEDAFGAATWSTEYVAFAQKAAMPRGGTAITTTEFAKMKAWVLRGMPQLDEAAGGGDAGTDAGGDSGADAASPDAALPTTCTAQTTPALATHLATMKTAGWGARLADLSTPMFGCGSGSGLGCLGTLPEVTSTYGAPNVTQKLRKLHAQDLASHYWVRSSADGRYLGYGDNNASKIIDLTKPATAPAIDVAAPYDPFFFPSNDGFAFAGSDAGGIRVCRQSLLADVGTAAHPAIALTEAKCTQIGSSVYESIGSALDGSRYFVTWGSHENDDGGNDITAPLPAAFGATAQTQFTPMVNSGLSFQAKTPIAVPLPGEGDMMLSPSSLLAATRFGDGQKQRGYRIRFVKATTSSAGATTIQLPLAAEVCLAGAKPSFSFDERFVAAHQYADSSEPDQAAANLPAGSSNIVIADLKTGTSVRITKMKAGQYALYPHFRADGWLYFLVRDMNAQKEYFVASDIALRASL